MTESIIFHFIFVIFIAWVFVWWFYSYVKLKNMRHSMMPVLLLQKLNFPTHRSLVVRALNGVKEELSDILQAKIDIHFKLNTHLECNNFVVTLACLMYGLTHEKNFYVGEIFYSSKELFLLIKNKENVKKIKFNLDHNFFWKVDIH